MKKSIVIAALFVAAMAAWFIFGPAVSWGSENAPAPAVASEDELVSLPDWEQWTDCVFLVMDDSGAYAQEECAGGFDRYVEVATGQIFMIGWGGGTAEPPDRASVRFALRFTRPSGSDLWVIGKRGGIYSRLRSADEQNPGIEFRVPLDTDMENTVPMSPMRIIYTGPGNPDCPVFPGE